MNTPTLQIIEIPAFADEDFGDVPDFDLADFLPLEVDKMSDPPTKIDKPDRKRERSRSRERREEPRGGRRSPARKLSTERGRRWCSPCRIHVTASNFSRHVATKHTQKEGRHLCKMCSQRFARRADRDRHETSHASGNTLKPGRRRTTTDTPVSDPRDGPTTVSAPELKTVSFAASGTTSSTPSSPREDAPRSEDAPDPEDDPPNSEEEPESQQERREAESPEAPTPEDDGPPVPRDSAPTYKPLDLSWYLKPVPEEEDQLRPYVEGLGRAVTAGEKALEDLASTIAMGRRHLTQAEARLQAKEEQRQLEAEVLQLRGEASQREKSHRKELRAHVRETKLLREQLRAYTDTRDRLAETSESEVDRQ